MTAHAHTVYDLIARVAAVHGDAPAVIHGEQARSFRELLARVDALAGGLAALGLGPGDRVCILAQNDPAYLELYGACARQGIVAYPINWRLTADEVARVVERAAPRVFVADASTLPVVGAASGAVSETASRRVRNAESRPWHDPSVHRDSARARVRARRSDGIRHRSPAAARC